MSIKTLQTRDIDRRSFLGGLIAAGGLAIAPAPMARTVFGQTGRRNLAPVKVSRNRIIREVVGLRPFRPEGYVVEAQKIANKHVIHNYGHGGAGITLSWGTASQAVDLVRAIPSPAPGRRPARPTARRFAVIGCGVNGLSTAILLQRRYQDGPGTVTIYSKDLPPETTSNIAGGYWSPVSAFDHDVTAQEFRQRFRAAARISNRAFQLLAGPKYGVRWLDIFNFSRSESGVQGDLPGGNDLYPNQQVHRDPANYFGFPFARQYSSMVIEPSIYLAALLDEFYTAGGKLVVKEFQNRDELMRLPELVIFNCTGLGARVLFNDEKLIPVRGQLEILLPQPEIDYCYLGPGYMFPRTDGIVLGGTFDHNDWSLEVNRGQADSILNTHAAMMRGV